MEMMSRIESVAKALHIPGELIKGQLFINLLGNNEMFIENYRKLIKVTSSEIMISGTSGCFLITGKKLEILSYNESSMRIRGAIYEIKNCKRGLYVT